MGEWNVPINNDYDDQLVVLAISKALSDFYTSLIAKINNLDIKKVMSNKNPYLFRAKAMSSASSIVDAILSAYVSSSEETIFGNVFFEPIATAVSQGHKALAEGIDIMIDKGDTIYAVAVKSGTKVFNAASKKKQEQNFLAAAKLAQQVKKSYVPIVGYCYGKKRITSKGAMKFYKELAGQKFWEELTGDSEFYKKIMTYMDKLPEKYIEEYNEAYQKASNRLVKEFTNEFCLEDGSIDWESLVEFNSGE